MDPDDILIELCDCADPEPSDWSFWFTVLFFAWIWS